MASQVFRDYSCFKSAYIIGAYARGFAHPSALVCIVAFPHEGHPVDFEKVHMGLEMAIGKPVKLLLSLPEDAVKELKISQSIPLVS